MSALSLKVEGFAGTGIRECCQEACRLARRLGIIVTFDFNGVHCMARPDGLAKDLEENWKLELASKKLYKIATTTPREPPQNGEVTK